MNNLSASGVENLHATVAAQGFGVPALVLRRIEGMRTRLHGEHPYMYYLEERFREVMYLRRTGGRWSVSSRRLLPDVVRSSYIDFLDAQWRKGAYVSSGVDDSLSDVIADPNYAIYARWMLRPGTVEGMSWMDHVREVEGTMASESSNAGDISFFETPKYLTNSAIHAYSKSIAKTYLGESFVSFSGLPALVKLKAPTSLFSLELHLADDKLIAKRGNIQCLFRWMLADEKFCSHPAVNFFFEDCLIGGEWYCRSDRSLHKVALAMRLYMIMLGTIFNKFSSWDFGVEF